MRFFPEEGYKRFFCILLYTIFGIGLIFATFRYLIPAFLPFLIAFPTAVLLRRPTLFITRHTHMPRRLVAPALAVTFVSFLLFVVCFAAWRGIREVGEFARGIINGENALLENLQAMFSRMEALIAKLPFSGGENAEALRNTLAETLLSLLQNVVSELGTKIPSLAGSLVSAVPQILVFAVVTILSSVYFCADYDKILSFFRKLPLGKARPLLEKLRNAAKNTLICVFRSYLLLFFCTFAELFLGFALLGKQYAFLLALITALVDSLPILGTGTVLLPFALYHFFLNDVRTAIGYCILYICVTIVRQILEPKILGAGVGVHPLIMIISMYAGLRLLGFFGMILFPIAATITKSIFSALRPKKEDTTHAS